MLKNRMTEIAIKLKRNTDSTSLALLMTLELAVIKKYKKEIIEQLKLNTKDLDKVRQIYNKAFHELSFKHNITEYCDDKTLRQITKYFIDASVEPEAIAQFIQEFTIEKSRNELYGFSTPIELKELMVSLLDIKSKESIYNPCFGIGGFFEDIAKINSDVYLYGEDIEETNRLIAGLTAQLSGIKDCSLDKRDVLLNSSHCNKKECKQFDKVICNPPLDLSLDVNKLKEDIRFKQYGTPPANASELAFLEHSLACMKIKAIVLVRLSVLTRTSNEAKVRTAITYDGKVETIIALPKGIIPQWKEDMALIVLSHNNKETMFLDLNKPYFSKRKGSRNTIYRVDEILELVKKRELTEHSLLIDIHSIDAHNLSPQHYINKLNTSKEFRQLVEITSKIYRAQRIAGSSDNTSSYFELSISDIVDNGYTITATTQKEGRTDRIKLFKLEEFDILLPLRGKAINIGIIGKVDDALVANSGILVIRLKDTDNAQSLYLYLKSVIGQNNLQKLYDESSNKTINPDILETLLIPIELKATDNDKLQKIFVLQNTINITKKAIEELLNS